MRNFKILTLLLVFAFSSCKDKDESSWKCISGDCYNVEESGGYDSESECNIICSSNSNNTNCNYTSYYGTQNCTDASYVAVSSTACCPSNAPFYCSSTGYCFETCEAAEYNGCTSVYYGTGQSSGSGSTSGYNCISGNCTYTSSNATYSSYSECEAYCSGGSSTSYGDVTFWTENDLGCGNITVYVNGYSSTISSYYYNGLSSCNSSGCANFSLPAGTYSFTASCTGYSWNGGTVTVTSNGCVTMELTL